MMTKSSEGRPPEPFELFALRYAHHGGRKASDNFMGGDIHESASALDYFVWVARRPGKTFVIDTGFGPEAAKERGRDLLRLPADALKLVGVDPAQVEDVILTHLHYDHAGTLDAFPRARFHVQEAESAYATGRCMCHPFLRHPYDVENVVAFVRHRLLGQHHAGLRLIERHQMLTALIRRDRRQSAPQRFYANMQRGLPFPAVYNVAEMMEAFKLINRLGESPEHIVPGHDPLVMKFYPPPSPELGTIAVRLDVPPNVSRG